MGASCTLDRMRKAARTLALLGLTTSCADGAVSPSAAASTSTGLLGTASTAVGSTSGEAPSTSTTEPPPSSSDGAGSDSTGEPDGHDETTTGAPPGDPGPPFELATLDAPHALVFPVKGPGQAWADVDGDGWLDLLTTGGAVPSRLWHNEQDGSFSLSPLTDDLSSYLDTVGASFADYDNDGDPDLYLLRAGPNVLLRNEGGLALVDVSAAAGVDDPKLVSSSTWGDYDADGWLDLFVANTAIHLDVLYHNEGNGQFSDASVLLPGRRKEQTYGASFSDFDGDGDLDLYAAYDKKVANQMWRNDGPGCGGWCFTDVSHEWGADIKVDSMGLAIGDYDNDLDLDISITDNFRHNVFANTLEQGSMGFVDVSDAVGVIYDAYGWGTVFFDYDNDGWLDLFVADAHLPPAISNRMFHNEGGTFSDVSDDCNCILVGWSHGVSYADYDHDGAVDFVVGNRGVRHDLFHNRNVSGNHWLTVELRGAGPIARDPVGARVYVITSTARVLMREVKLGSSVASQNSTRLHFGLGADDLAAVQVRWPDGTVELPPPPPIDALWVHTYPGG